MSLDATRWAWIQRVERSTAKLVLLSIADRADENHIAYPSVQRIVADTELDRKTVMSSIAYLEEKGIIETIKHNGSVNKYRLIGVPGREQTSPKNGTGKENPTSPKNGTGTSPKIGTGTKNGTGPKNGTAPVPKTGPLPVPFLGHEPTNEPTKNLPNNSRAHEDAFVLPPGVDPQAWDTFEKYRRGIKKPLDDDQRRIAVNLLVTQSIETQRQMVDAAILSRWTGLFPPKQNDHGRKQTAPINSENFSGKKYVGTDINKIAWLK